jgi:fibro-slime domain-containing protein
MRGSPDIEQAIALECDMNRQSKPNAGLAALGLLSAAVIVYFSFASDALGQGQPGSSASTPTSVSLTGVIRDFRERSVPGGHPDFEQRPDAGFGLYLGNIGPTLDSEGKPVFLGGGYKCLQQWTDAAGRPIHPSLYDPAQGDLPGVMGTQDNGGIKDELSFSQWFRDVPGVNMSETFSISLIKDESTGRYVFDDRLDTLFSKLSGFFPINGQLAGNSDGENKNFHFTFEIETRFTHSQGAENIFTFRGDDDVWVFIDDKQVIDIGGVHGAIEQTVPLDRLGLVDGQSYKLKFFFAERHRTQSNFRIETTLDLRTGGVPTTTAMFD